MFFEKLTLIVRSSASISPTSADLASCFSELTDLNEILICSKDLYQSVLYIYFDLQIFDVYAQLRGSVENGSLMDIFTLSLLYTLGLGYLCN